MAAAAAAAAFQIPTSWAVRASRLDSRWWSGGGNDEICQGFLVFRQPPFHRPSLYPAANLEKFEASGWALATVAGAAFALHDEACARSIALNPREAVCRPYGTPVPATQRRGLELAHRVELPSSART